MYKKKNIFIKSAISVIVTLVMLFSQLSPMTEIVKAEMQKAAVQQKWNDILNADLSNTNGSADTLNAVTSTGDTYANSTALAGSAGDETQDTAISSRGQLPTVDTQYKGTRFIIKYKTAVDQQNAQSKYASDKKVKRVQNIHNANNGRSIRQSAKNEITSHNSVSPSIHNPAFNLPVQKSQSGAGTAADSQDNTTPIEALDDNFDQTSADSLSSGMPPRNAVVSVSSQDITADALTLDTDTDVSTLENDLLTQGIVVDYVQPDYELSVSALPLEEAVTAESEQSGTTQADTVSTDTSQDESSQPELKKISLSQIAPALDASGIKLPISSLQADGKLDISDYQPLGLASNQQNAVSAEQDWSSFYSSISSALTTSNGSGVLIALMDSGIETTHPSLDGKLDLTDAWDFFNGDSSVDDSDWAYDQGHGTYLASIIVGDLSGANIGGGNAISVAAGAKVLPLKIFQGGVAYTSDILNAIAYAESLGVKIVNCSWGCGVYNRALEEAIAGSSMLFVCAAGNTLTNLDKYPVYPAAFRLPNTIAVSSVDSNGKHSRFSNYGVNTVDVAAPGRDITGAWINGSYVPDSGTSVSAAFVSGEAALLLAENNNYTASDLKNAIISSSDSITGLENKIHNGKRINLVNSANGTVGSSVDIPDPEELPDVAPGESIQDETYKQFGAQDSVTIKSDMLTAREGLGAAGINGKLYAFGGNFDTTYYNKTEVLDPKSGNPWSAGKPMLTPRARFGYTTYNGKIYVFGGENSGGYLSSVEMYDPSLATNNWVSKAPMPIQMSWCTATVCSVNNHDYIYIVGGKNAAGYSNAVYRYDIANDTWNNYSYPVYPNPIGSIYVQRAGHVTVAYNGYLYVEGGNVAGSQGYTEERFNLSTNSPSSSGISRGCYTDSAGVSIGNRFIAIGGSYNRDMGPYSGSITQRDLTADNPYFINQSLLSTPKAGMAAALLDGNVYIVGGRYDDGQGNYYIYKTTECLESGYEVKAKPPVQAAYPLTVENNGQMYLMGGFLPNGTIANLMYAYDPITDTWTPKANPPPVLIADFNYHDNDNLHEYAFATSLNGKIYLFGGVTPDGYESATIYVYDPTSDTWGSSPFDYLPYWWMTGVGKAISYGGCIYIYNPVCSIYPSYIYVFDPSAPQGSRWGYISGDQSQIDNNVYGRLFNVNNKLVYIYDGKTCTYNGTTGPDPWIYQANTKPYISRISSQINGNIFSLSSIGGQCAFIKYDYANNLTSPYGSFNYYGDIFETCPVNNNIYLLTVSSLAGNRDYPDSWIKYSPPVNQWANSAANSYGYGTAYLCGGQINGKIYMTGGYGSPTSNSAFQVINDLKVFDPATNKMTKPTINNSSAFTARQRATASALNSKLYIIGGSTSGRSDGGDYLPSASIAGTNLNQIYDPTTGNWSSGAILPYPAHSLASAVYGGKIYTFGGRSDASVSGNVYEYNPSIGAAGTWTQKASMAPRYGASAVCIDNKIYVIGGFDALNQAVGTVGVYDPTTNTWSNQTYKAMPTAFGYSSAVTDGSQIYIIGGLNNAWSSTMIYQYNPAADTWFSWPGQNFSVGGNYAAYQNGSIYSFNGVSFDGFFNNITNQIPLNMISVSADLLHFGSDEINVSGNLSRTYTDMSQKTPGFTMNISRTYNSLDDRTDGYLGKGWSFGFQGKVETLGNNTVVRLPDGSAQTFLMNADAISYTAKDSRSVLKRTSPTGPYTLTTKDQYSYGFNTSGYLCWMKDKYGNTINITVDSNGKISTIVDPVGRSFTLGYNAAGSLITGVTETVAGTAIRSVSYVYDANNRLIQAKDPNGSSTYYGYDPNSGLLNSVKNNSNNTTIESFVYSQNGGNSEYKIASSTDRYGNITKYDYNINDGTLTTTDSNNRQTKAWFDKTLYPIKTQDAEGKGTTIQYSLDAGINKYGEPKMVTDRNGNVTSYGRDPNNGNILSVTNPDNSQRTYAYDANNNMILAIDENKKRTEYIYDTDGYANDTSKNLLLKTIQPLNGTTAYSASEDQNQYAITSLAYYTSADTPAMCGGHTVYGLVKTSTDPTGYVTQYTYDTYGNTASTQVLGINNPPTYYTNNILGWLTKTTTPKGYATSVYYDKNGNVLKTVLNGGETTRNVYDALGELIQQIPANQYAASSDTATFDNNNIVNVAGSYSQTGQGTSYAYNPSGTLQSVTQRAQESPGVIDYKTSYEYDKYGNKTKETQPNGGISNYYYDVLNRLTSRTYQDSSASGAQTFERHDYVTLSNGHTTVTDTAYQNATTPVVSDTEYDYAQRPVKVTYPDNTTTSTVYNANGTVSKTTDRGGLVSNYQYDGLNRQTDVWVQSVAGSGAIYQYTGTQYDVAGRVKEKLTGRNYVNSLQIPTKADCVWTINDYNKDGTINNTTDSADGKTTYSYDADGNATEIHRYISATEFNIEQNTYNYLEKVATHTQFVDNQDIDNMSAANGTTALITSYEYDKAGNIHTMTTPDRVITTYGYDLLNRQTSVSQPGKDQNGATAAILTSKTYDWRGKTTSSTDENGNRTSYTYDTRGNLIQTVDPMNGTHQYQYDYMGNLTAEVTPLNYKPGMAITDNPNHTEYQYDLMNRPILKLNKYIDPLTSASVSEAVYGYQYDVYGNIIKSVDALGYKAGTDSSGTGSATDQKIASAAAYGTVYTYDALGHILTVQDPETAARNLPYTSKYKYDGLGRKIQALDANNNSTTYNYDDHSNITSVFADGFNYLSGRLSAGTYDLLGNRLTSTDAEINTTTYTYNASG